MAIYRKLNGKIVHVAYDLKCKNGRMKDGNKRRFRNLLKALDLLMACERDGQDG